MAADPGPRLSPVEVLDRLVAFDSVSDRPNRALIDWVAEYLRGHGIAPLVLPSPDGAKANLFATIGPDGPDGIVLSGHTDVVPVADQQWDSDPFALTARDGLLYGRGTADMKGFLAIALALVPEIAARDLARPIHLAMTYDEETGCIGIRHLLRHILEHLPRPGLVIVGEPTSMKPVNAHKSVRTFRTMVTGQAAHSSAPHLGVSAISAAAEIVAFIDRLAEDAKQHAAPASGFAPPHATFNVGTIEGGAALNIIPGQCHLAWDFRALPGEDTDAVLDRYRAFIDGDLLPRLRARSPAATIETEALANVPAMVPDPDGPAETLARQLTGANAAGVVAFASEAGLFQQAGISTVICGPGDIAQAHQPNEFITFEQMAAGEAFLRRVADWAA